MPRLSLEQVHAVAALARLRLSDPEAERMQADLDQILDYVETLQELDTAGIEPTAHAFELATPLREDRAVPAMPPELAVANAPEAVATAFVVPKVIEGEEEG